MARELATTLFLFALLVTRIPLAAAEEPEFFFKMIVKKEVTESAPSVQLMGMKDKELVFDDSLGWRMSIGQEQEVTSHFMLLPPETHNIAPHRSNPWQTMYISNDSPCLTVNLPNQKSYISHDSPCLRVSNDVMSIPEQNSYISHDMTPSLYISHDSPCLYISHDGPCANIAIPQDMMYISHDMTPGLYISHDTRTAKVDLPDTNSYISHDMSPGLYISHDTRTAKVDLPDTNSYISHDMSPGLYISHDMSPGLYISHDSPCLQVTAHDTMYVRHDLEEILIQPAMVHEMQDLYNDMHKIYVHPEMVMVTDDGLYFIDDRGTPRKISQVHSDENGVYLLANL